MPRHRVSVGIAVLAVTFVYLERRNLLWRAVQTCVLNHRLTGSSFPCLDVIFPDGADSGYVVLRSPLDRRHIVVVPTVKIIGIEARRLQESYAANYMDDAWRSRRFLFEDFASKPAPTDFGLAINSGAGRSQDQLHIHIDCVLASVKDSLRANRSDVGSGRWTLTDLKGADAPYWATRLPSASLAQSNVFELARAGLKRNDQDMRELSLAVVATSDADGDPKFVLLARRRQGNPEILLDHDCGSRA